MQNNNLKNNYHPFTTKALEIYHANSDADYAVWMSAYMKNNFPFLGIKSPVRAEISKVMMVKENLPSVEELKEVVWELWLLPEREFQYLALELLNKMSGSVPEKFIDEYELLIQTKSWWDSIDTISPNVVAQHFKRFPHLIPVYTEKWLKSNNIWLQRSSLLFQLKAKSNTDLDLLYYLISQLKSSREFFIQKAIGWILREYSKTNPDEVKRFVKSANLKPLSHREALKWMERKDLKS